MSKGKGRFDLISPIVMARFAKHFENGSAKYGDRNWELGQPIMTYVDSANRHLNKFLRNLTDEDHLSAAMWNVHCMIHTLEMIQRGKLPKELDNRPADHFDGPEKEYGTGVVGDAVGELKPVELPKAPVDHYGRTVVHFVDGREAFIVAVNSYGNRGFTITRPDGMWWAGVWAEDGNPKIPTYFSREETMAAWQRLHEGED